ncbi:hypothetical protein QYQ98_05065 [Corynebacterium sp. P3-F1]|uniref:hypothetical protein n=1 Tax=Corynebacterium sp. P3-F1 TaxID=3059080 RepID=UPI00265CC490|nr:hypothetical protein [Corynebacterium sp. P3-F1]WKK60455.1 hypothetical protein QYQ98_05065 [Corynebacterium sp. P3-F1]
MTHETRAPRAHRVAVVGAGAAGIHASDTLICMPETSGRSYFVDLFDAAPAPTGLIRFAAEHREAPSPVISTGFDTGFETPPAALVPRLRLFGNVRIGTDITVGDLTHYYDTVIVASGAPLTGNSLTHDSLTIVGTSAEASAIYEHFRAASSPAVTVSRTPVVTEPSPEDQPGAIVVFLKSRAIPFTTWRGWHRPAWVNRETAGAVVSVDKWNAILAGGLAIPAVP